MHPDAGTRRWDSVIPPLYVHGQHTAVHAAGMLVEHYTSYSDMMKGDWVDWVDEKAAMYPARVVDSGVCGL